MQTASDRQLKRLKARADQAAAPSENRQARRRAGGHTSDASSAPLFGMKFPLDNAMLVLNCKGDSYES
eukprot:4739215-Alexandrium_andersonii.AAC.1